MPVALDGVFFAILWFVVGLIRAFRVHQAVVDIAKSLFWLAISTLAVFYVYEGCMGRAGW